MFNKTILFTLIYFFLGLKTKAQSTIESIFLKLPIEIYNSSFDLNFKKELLKHKTIYKNYTEKGVEIFYNREELPENIPNSSFVSYSIENLLPKNGYIKFSTETNFSDNGDNFEICYWSLNNGNKLAALTYFPSGTDTSQIINFFEIGKENIVQILNSNIIPVIKLDDVIKHHNLTAEEFNSISQIFQDHQILHYELPIKGKNIIVRPDINGDLNDKENQLRSKIIQQLWKKKVELIWNDGYFNL